MTSTWLSSFFGSPTKEEKEAEINVPPADPVLPPIDTEREDALENASIQQALLKPFTPPSSRHNSAPTQDADNAETLKEREQGIFEREMTWVDASTQMEASLQVDASTQVDADEDVSTTRPEGYAQTSALNPSSKLAQRLENTDGGTAGSVHSARRNYAGENNLMVQSRRQRVLEGLMALRSKHADVLARRVMAEESRTRLKTLKEALENKDFQFMQNLRLLLERNSIPKFDELQAHFETLKTARNEFKKEELDHEILEADVVTAEFELKELESQIYPATATFSASHPDSQEESIDYAPQERDPTESDVSSLNIRADTSLEARLYMSQMGDVDLLRERLMDMETEYAQVTEEQALREDLGLAPDANTKMFLETYETTHEQLRQQFKKSEERLTELEDILPEKEDRYSPVGPFADTQSEAEGPSKNHSQFGGDDYYDDEMLTKENLENPKVVSTASLFLMTHAESSSVYSRALSNANGVSINKESYVNSWLLYHLRRSTSEVARLILEHEQYGLDLSPESFKEQVLLQWEEDCSSPAFSPPRTATEARDVSMATNSRSSPHSRAVSDTFLEIALPDPQHIRRSSSTKVKESTA